MKQGELIGAGRQPSEQLLQVDGLLLLDDLAGQDRRAVRQGGRAVTIGVQPLPAEGEHPPVRQPQEGDDAGDAGADVEGAQVEGPRAVAEDGVGKGDRFPAAETGLDPNDEFIPFLQ